jgi:hypothetical protein
MAPKEKRTRPNSPMQIKKTSKKFAAAGVERGDASSRCAAQTTWAIIVPQLECSRSHI